MRPPLSRRQFLAASAAAALAGPAAAAESKKLVLIAGTPEPRARRPRVQRRRPAPRQVPQGLPRPGDGRLPERLAEGRPVGLRRGRRHPLLRRRRRRPPARPREPPRSHRQADGEGRRPDVRPLRRRGAEGPGRQGVPGLDRRVLRDGYSCNPMWTPEFKEFPKHPIANGVKPFTVRDEWYFNMRFRDRHEGRDADPRRPSPAGRGARRPVRLPEGAVQAHPGGEGAARAR